MALRATIPQVKEARFKALLYANTGAGKTHFCCSLPEVYYIDNEGLEDYPKYVNMLKDNKSVIAYINDLSDIIVEAQQLLNTKHPYKTVVIDSISFPYGWLAQTEAERLIKKKPDTEGTEFGVNTAKAKRLTFQLGILLSRLDMNVIVCSHEKTKMIKGTDVGMTFDVSDKLAYALGTVLNLRLMGSSRKVFVEKSRYDELPNNGFIDFNDGYETLKKLFGESIFVREMRAEKFATPEQISELKSLLRINKINEERQTKMLTLGKAICFDELTEEYILAVIKQLTPKQEENNEL